MSIASAVLRHVLSLEGVRYALGQSANPPHCARYLTTSQAWDPKMLFDVLGRVSSLQPTPVVATSNADRWEEPVRKTRFP